MRIRTRKRTRKMEEKKIPEFEIEKYIHSLHLHPILEKAALYTLMLPGKRLRPNFLTASAEDFRVSKKTTSKAAMAIEMMHAASLIHDDLPAVDNDNYRRGKPSNHVVFGEDVAIMAGDLLFSTALHLCEEIDESVSVAFSKTLVDLVDGETRDIIMSKSNDVTVDEIVEMYRKKTGALFAFAFSFGPRIAKQSTEKYEEAGYNFGVSFQILDDILDVTSTFEKIGKTPQKDAEQHKATLVQKIGVEDSHKIADTLYRKVLLNLKDSEKLLKEVKKSEKLLRKR